MGFFYLFLYHQLIINKYKTFYKMAQKPNPKKVAAVIAATKAQAGGRPVVIRKKTEGPQPGMPGSNRMAQLKEVIINPESGDKKIATLAVGQSGGGSLTYSRDEVVNAFRNANLNREADALSKLTSISKNDLSDMVNKIIKSKGIKALQKAQ